MAGRGKIVVFGDSILFRGAVHTARKTITAESILQEVNEFAVPLEQWKSTYLKIDSSIESGGRSRGYHTQLWLIKIVCLLAPLCIYQIANARGWPAG